jgi:DNA-binding LacI/PurR family transcriptional regulator
MATIKDIAKNLDLSFSTVSRALNDHPAISKKTKQLVEAEARRLNFAFNTSAKSLTSNKAYTITLLVDIDDEQSFQNPYFYEEMHGIERYVYQKEYSLIVANIKTAPKKQNMIDFLVKSKRTDGIILPSNIIDDELVAKLCEHNIPFVSIGQPSVSSSPISWVDIDNFRGGQSAAQHLLQSGCHKIAFLGHNPKKFFSQKRYEGYLSALATHNIQLNKDLITTCGNSKEDGYECARELFKKHPDIDGIICGDEIISIGVIRALSELGKKIPEQVSLISFDNGQIAQLSFPSITTIDVDVFELGYQSAKLLFDQIEHTSLKNQGILIGTAIELRETTRKKES